ncbi:benzoate/H(+) symporter BenE family transporter [Devosia sp. XJ19-1]|uniref:Benzoate/H(+) symporter BenE family transporter n=1 Tax=Devosia ureilytica TaxID=2952754 RepID=A0A9Q4AL97_9HYPH|nr:benzoate/H(+) symporter BenE family transporter [Devosia ureilytica]MCP8882421.1 benzoate/H(+) symporter BenE family transporter [Devosia ureilytica]MCP8885692.1 benzoate/H(+) symporter BenE family transporter [Devosia ureilytica]
MSADVTTLASRDYAQPIFAGMLAAVVGSASTFTLVLAALAAGGASPQQAGSGLLSVCVAMGLLNVVVAWRIRTPVSFAWTTPGMAFLLTVGEPVGGFPAAAGAFLVCAAMIVLTGMVGPLGRAIAAIPAVIANAMLAGMLLTLCLAPINAVAEMPWHTLPILCVWALALRFARRYAVPLAVCTTAIILATTTQLPQGTFDGAWPMLVPVMPEFSLDAIVRIALPLYIVTMASQNLPGIAVMKSNGFTLQPSPLFVATGVASAATAFFGGPTSNLAAITAAICAGPEAHPDADKRWPAPIAAGVTYILFGLTASLAAAFIAASPPLLIQAVAGLALFSSLAAALAAALADEETRLPAILTFVATASGITIVGVGAPFWGMVGGIVLLLLLKRNRQT